MQVSHELTIKATIVFEKNWQALHSDARFIKNEGGSRSSKTYSICQALILYSLQNPKKLVSIIRKTGPALRATVYRDFFEVMKNLNLYDSARHRKLEGLYEFENGSLVEFFSADQEQKLRGRKRDIAWCNEANELRYDDFQQIALRTNEKIIVDYNPSAVESYLYHFPLEKCISIHSTYQDNPFLSKEIIEQIESYKFTDPDYYTIFALGQRSFSRENVFVQWTTLSSRPTHFTDHIYAIDYGFSHPTALLRIWFTRSKREVFVEELIYESHLTSNDIIERMQSQVDKSKIVVSETARPEIVQDLKRNGFKVINADKNVRDGIANVKTFVVLVDENAHNLIMENGAYRYKKFDGRVTEEVIKLYDDCMDALRYGLMYVKKYCLQETNQPTQIYSFDF